MAFKSKRNLFNASSACPLVKSAQVFRLRKKAAKERPATIKLLKRPKIWITLQSSLQPASSVFPPQWKSWSKRIYQEICLGLLEKKNCDFLCPCPFYEKILNCFVFFLFMKRLWHALSLSFYWKDYDMLEHLITWGGWASTLWGIAFTTSDIVSK